MRPNKAYLEAKIGELSGFVVLEYETGKYYISFTKYFDVSMKEEVPVLEKENILNESRHEAAEYPGNIQEHAQETFEKYTPEIVQDPDSFTGTKGENDGWTP